MNPEILFSGIGVIAMIVAGVMGGRSRAKDSAIRAQQITIDALKDEIDSVRTVSQEEARRCEERLAEVEGRMQGLTTQHAATIAELLAPRLTTAIHEEMTRWRHQ